MLVLIASVALPSAFAQVSTELTLTNIGPSQINLFDAEKDRVIRAYAEFENFNLDDKYFVMEIIRESNGQTIHSSQIVVGSTASDIVSFNSQVIYVITDEMLEEYLISPGDYQMQVKTKGGSIAESISFSITN